MRLPVDVWLGLVYCLLLSSCSYEPDYTASGTLERDRIVLTAPLSEFVIDLPVREGTEVEEGTVLVRLDTTKQELILKQARAALQQARHQLDKLQKGERAEDIRVGEASLNEAKAQLAEKEKRLARLETLAIQSLTSQAELDAAIASRDTAAASVMAAQQRLKKMTSGFRQEDILQAKDILSAAQARVALETQKLRELTIVATRHGILDALPYKLGERVAMNNPVAVIQANEKPYARVYIPEPIKSHFKLGTQVQVHIDGVQDPITGSVRWLAVDPAFTPYSSMSEDDRSRFVYLAEIDLAGKADTIPSGIPVQVKWNR